MPEMHLKQPGFTYNACGPFTKNKEKIQKYREQEIQTIFTNMNLISLVFNMTWLMEIFKREQEEQLLIKFELIKHLILLKILNMTDIKGGLFL